MKYVITGGSGLLGSNLRELVPDALYPERFEFDITDFDQMDQYLQLHPVEGILHAAAFTSPPKIEEDPEKALIVNIAGTVNVVRLAIKYKLRLIYISTDYVFDGNKGSYSETDPVLPGNKYAWSKLGGECAVRLWDNSLIVRTTFGPNVFPYPKAFVDQWTSRESVDKIAEMLVPLLDSAITGLIHVGGDRKTVYEYAKKMSPKKEIGKISITEISFSVPKDTSLDTSRYKTLIEKKA